MPEKSKAERYRDHAEEVRVLGQDMRDPYCRQQMLNTAAAWDRMAEHEDRKINPSNPADSPPAAYRQRVL